MSRPTIKPKFATNNGIDAITEQPNTIEPIEDIKLSGWTRKQKPYRQYLNWLHKTTYNWIEWLDSLFEESFSNSIPDNGTIFDQSLKTIDSPTFLSLFIDKDNGPKLINNNGTLEIRDHSGNDYADLSLNNLTVHGTTTTIYSETLTIADNIVVLNSNVTGIPTENGGIEVERGIETNSSLIWNETSDLWEISNGADIKGILKVNSNFINNNGVVNKGINFDSNNLLNIMNTSAVSGDIRNNIYIWDDTTMAQGVGGGISFGGKCTTAGDYGTLAGIKGYKTNSTSANYSGQLHFQTKLNGSAATTKMIIDENGNVGIGTISTIDAKLHVNGGRLLIAPLIGTNGQLVITANSGNAFYIQNENDGSRAYLQVGITEAITIKKGINEGYVGIGILPSARLHVNGTSQFNGIMTFSGTNGEGIVLNRSSGNGYIAFQNGLDVNQWHMWHSNINNTLKIYTSNGISSGIFTIGSYSIDNFYLDTSSGNIGLGTSLPSVKLDISYGGTLMLLGADDSASTRTNNTNKLARLCSPHYLTAEENVSFATFYNTSFSNAIYIGGGSSSLNATTEIVFYTATNVTTTIGIERMRIDNNGNINISSLTALRILELDSSKNIISVSKNTAYNKNFGIGHDDVAYGDHSHANLNVSGTLDVHSDARFYTNVQIDSNLDMTDGNINNINTLMFNNASAYIIRLEEDTDTGIHYDVTNKLWSWYQNGTQRAYINLDNGNFQVDGFCQIDGLLDANNGADIEGAVDISTTLDSHGTAHFYSTVQIDGLLDANNGADIEGAVDIGTTLDSHGAAHFYAAVTIDGNLDINDGDINNINTLMFNNASAYIIRLEEDIDTGIYYNITNNTWEWHQNGTQRAYIDLDNGNFQVNGFCQIDGLLDANNGADIEGSVDISIDLIVGGLLRINNNKIRIQNSKTPISATDVGNTGDICWDSNYVYICVATNIWKRAPISTWP